MMPLSRDLLIDESLVDTYMKSLQNSGETKWCQRRLEVEKIRPSEAVIIKVKKIRHLSRSYVKL